MTEQAIPKLYSAWFCPFAQRAWIALLAKGTEFEYVEKDPYNKTPELLAANPRGLKCRLLSIMASPFMKVLSA